MILAADIGGTKVNLGVYETGGNRLKLVTEGARPSRKYARLQDLVKDFLGTAGNPRIERACFGLAGPVRNGRAQLTNLPWIVEAGELAAELGIGAIELINDLEANGFGLAELTPADFHTLNAGQPDASGNAAIISAGTGLGQAGLYWDGSQHRPFACEGGHSDFAPLTPLDAELFEWLRSRFLHVSWEKVLSGPGLHNIYEFLRETRRGEEPPSFAAELAASDPAAAITEAAVKGTSSRCEMALELFVTYYGSEAGNLALKLMATAGVYVGGGIAPRILARLEHECFIAAFTSKGRMRPMLSAMPVKVILNPKTALLGAAHVAAFGQKAIAGAL